MMLPVEIENLLNGRKLFLIRAFTALKTFR